MSFALYFDWTFVRWGNVFGQLCIWIFRHARNPEANLNAVRKRSGRSPVAGPEASLDVWKWIRTQSGSRSGSKSGRLEGVRKSGSRSRSKSGSQVVGPDAVRTQVWKQVWKSGSGSGSVRKYIRTSKQVICIGVSFVCRALVCGTGDPPQKKFVSLAWKTWFVCTLVDSETSKGMFAGMYLFSIFKGFEQFWN